MRTTAWLNKKYGTLHHAMPEPPDQELRDELMPLCDQEAAEAVIYARGAALKEACDEIKRLHGEAGVLRTWIKAALVPLQSIADLEDFEDGGDGMNALIAAGRAVGA